METATVKKVVRPKVPRLSSTPAPVPNPIPVPTTTPTSISLQIKNPQPQQIVYSSLAMPGEK